MAVIGDKRRRSYIPHWEFFFLGFYFESPRNTGFSVFKSFSSPQFTQELHLTGIMIFNYLLSLFVLAGFSIAADSPTPVVEVVGNKFYFTNNGSQFLMRGIAYQQNTNGSTSYSDPLANEDECKRDVEYFKQLNTNTLRVYAVDPTSDHDPCMKIFEDAGIYIIADLSEPKTSINRENPEWNLELYDRYTSVVDMFSKYSNVLGFFAGNEVTNNRSNTDASAFVKAAVRDMKTYIKDKDYRNIPVGYSSNDDEDTRVAIADYFSCGEIEERADFFGINMYEWCGDSTFRASGYMDRTEEYKNLTIPIFFSEYGCNAERPRKFTEVGTLFSDDMTDVWSGGIVYMYHEEDNEYGLVSIDSSGDVSTLADFKYYSSEINNISPSYAKSSSLSQDATKTLACPASAKTWEASPSLPPTPDKEFCDCVAQNLECVVKDDVKTKDYGKLYGSVCSNIDCSAISGDGIKGSYGQVSFCEEKDKLSFVLNKYYLDQNRDSSACDFGGSASINKGATSASSCSSAIARATSSSSKSGSSRSGGSSASGSSSGSSSSTKSSSASISFKTLSKGELMAIAGVITSIVGGISFVVFE